MTILGPALSQSLVLNDKALAASDYARRYREARAEAMRMSIETRRKIAKVYEQAADEAARVVRDGLERGLSTLTTDRWASLAAQLKSAAKSLSEGTEREGIALIERTASLFPEIDADYLSRIAKLAGADRLTKAGFDRMVSGISTRVVESMTTRLWSDGYTFSERIWGGVQDDWYERMRVTISGGIAQGRDPIKIARDIQVYTTGGKEALLGRWGGLMPGTAQYAKRLPGRIDWRALRVVRSELNASLQDAGLMAGEANPGTTGEYDWVLQGGRLHYDCECEDLAAGGPYTADQIPSYPHSNCGCSVRPRLRDQKAFLADLKRWARGEDVDYLDKWYRGTYQGAAENRIYVPRVFNRVYHAEVVAE